MIIDKEKLFEEGDLTFDDVMDYLQRKYNENEEKIKKLDKQLILNTD